MVIASEIACACSVTTPCTIEGGSYLAATPKDWDGKTAMPIVIFLHGYDSSAQDVLANNELVQGLSERHALLIVPQGIKNQGGKTGWSFASRENRARDDIDFLDRVMKDAARRFPVDTAHSLVSGFSLGGSMVWYLACFGHTHFTAYAPIAGSFWVPEPEDCPSGPQNIRHIHGISDETMPMIGRVVGPPEHPSRQGMVMRGINTWQKVNGCAQVTPRLEALKGQICRIWPAQNCTSGRELVLCLHDEGHFYKGDWVAQSFDWMMGLNLR